MATECLSPKEQVVNSELSQDMLSLRRLPLRLLPKVQHAVELLGPRGVEPSE